MRRLYLMRHAKSSWKTPLPDHERPLNKRGKAAAKLIGRALGKRGIVFERAVVSDARRARATAKRVLRAMGGFPPEKIRLEPALYEASFPTILRVIRSLDDRDASVFLVAHNPGISETAVALSGNEEFGWLPTGAVVGLEFPVRSWREIGEKKGKVVLFLFPRRLEG